MGLDSMPQAMVSHRRLLSRAVTPAEGSFIVLMEPDKAQRRVTEMIKGLTTGLWRNTESEEWKDDGRGSRDQSQAREHGAARRRTETGQSCPMESERRLLCSVPIGKGESPTHTMSFI